MEAVFTALNAVALAGWTFVLALLTSQLSFFHSLPLLSHWATPFLETTATSSNRELLIDLLIFLEVICFVEVARIAIGQLKGNLTLGVILHIIRMSCLWLVLPARFSNGSPQLITFLVLSSWALTEVGRYPMYLFPSSSKAKKVRLVLPIFTFPVGAFAEAVGAYRALSDLWNKGRGLSTTDPGFWVKVLLLVMVIGVNSLLGPTLAYPALLKKGWPVLTAKLENANKQKKK